MGKYPKILKIFQNTISSFFDMWYTICSYISGVMPIEQYLYKIT